MTLSFLKRGRFATINRVSFSEVGQVSAGEKSLYLLDTRKNFIHGIILFSINRLNKLIVGHHFFYYWTELNHSLLYADYEHVKLCQYLLFV
jgi:hypothetical protein